MSTTEKIQFDCGHADFYGWARACSTDLTPECAECAAEHAYACKKCNEE